MRPRWCWWFGLLVVTAGVPPALAQRQITPNLLPQNLVVPFQPVGAKAAAMGGAFVADARGIMAGAWNPAGLVRGRGFDLGADVAAQVRNLDTNDVQDLLDDLRDALDQQNLTVAFNGLRNFAQSTGGNPIVGVLTPNAGISIGDFISFTTYAQGSGRVVLTDDPANNQVLVRGAGFIYGTAQVSYAQRLGKGTVLGISGRYIVAYYRPFDLAVTQNNVTFTVDEDDRDTAVTFDLGLLLQRGHSATGIVVRNVTSPKLRFQTPNTGTNEVTLDPEIDIGWAIYGHDGTTTMAFELHNLGGRNNGPTTVHIGLEQRLGDFLALRTGLNDGQWVGGVGLRLGPIALDATLGESIKDYTAVGFRLNF